MAKTKNNLLHGLRESTGVQIPRSESALLSINEALRRLHGEAVFILCARYSYRGILAEIGDSWVRLTQARAVEITGGDMEAQRPERETAIGSDVLIRIEFIELVAQPGWTGFELEV